MFSLHLQTRQQQLLQVFSLTTLDYTVFMIMLSGQPSQTAPLIRTADMVASDDHLINHIISKNI